MTKTLSEKESISISYMRVLAMCSIVLCHFMQSLNNHWAWVFNIGVQVFLLISGYLYGHKHVEKWLQWYWKRFVRIYIPFILFFIAIVPLYAVSERISIKNIVVYFADMQGVLGGVKGLGHLWFLTAIALCYTITPILQWLSCYGRLLIWCVIIVAAVILLGFSQYGQIASWFILYTLGYFLASVKQYEKMGLGLLAVCVIFLLSSSFSWDEMMHSNGSWCISFHIVGALIIFLTGLFIVSLLKNHSVPGYVRFIDKYSFQIYIVHHILIMPPFGMLQVTDYIVLNVIVVLMYLAFYTWILCTMEVKVDSIIKKCKPVKKTYCTN